MSQSERNLQDEEPSDGSSQSQTMTVEDGLPSLHTPHRRRRLIIGIGIVLLTLDLCFCPITYYYALKFGTNLGMQDIFAVITGVYGMISFTHYAFRSLKLFRSKTSPSFRPVGWTRWGLLEFLQVNVLIVITLVEIELVAGTAPSKPIVRLCAMPSPTICFYLGFLFVGSAIATHLQWKLPFNMSSTPKGSPWRPALLAFIEDAGGIEGRGGLEYRRHVIKRYEESPVFQRLILFLSWMWGLGAIGIAIISTVLIMVLSEDVGFGVGWGLPYAWAAVWTLVTVILVKWQLKHERKVWRLKRPGSIPRGVV